MESYKFRAKVNNPKSNMDGQWYYFTLQEAFKADPIMCRNLDWSTLGMWTTLVDKNGKPEYEKDIVEFVYLRGLWRGVVEYDPKRACFVYAKARRIDKKVDFDPIVIPLCEIERWLTGVSEEVIGDIYSNPDLLTASKEEE